MPANRPTVRTRRARARRARRARTPRAPTCPDRHRESAPRTRPAGRCGPPGSGTAGSGTGRGDGRAESGAAGSRARPAGRWGRPRVRVRARELIRVRVRLGLRLRPRLRVRPRHRSPSRPRFRVRVMVRGASRMRGPRRPGRRGLLRPGRRPVRPPRPPPPPRPTRLRGTVRAGLLGRGPPRPRVLVTWHARHCDGRPRRRGPPGPEGPGRALSGLPVPEMVPTTVTVAVTTSRPTPMGGRPRQGTSCPTRVPVRRRRGAGPAGAAVPTLLLLRGVGVAVVPCRVRRLATAITAAAAMAMGMGAGRRRWSAVVAMRSLRAWRPTVRAGAVARREVPRRRGLSRPAPRARGRPRARARATSPVRRCVPRATRRSGRGRPGATKGEPQRVRGVVEPARSEVRGLGPTRGRPGAPEDVGAARARRTPREHPVPRS